MTEEDRLRLVQENEQLRQELARIRSFGAADQAQATLDHLSLLATTLANRLQEREDKLQLRIQKQAIYVKLAEEHLRVPAEEWPDFHARLSFSPEKWDSLMIPWSHLSTQGVYKDHRGALCEVRVCPCGELLARLLSRPPPEPEEDMCIEVVLD